MENIWNRPKGANMIIFGPGKNYINGEKWILEEFIYLRPESTGFADRILWVMKKGKSCG